MMPPRLPSVPPVLLTRPVEASEGVAATLRARGATVLISPLLSIRRVSILPPLRTALILTSRNGVACYQALGGPGGLPVWCVGRRTAQAAQDAGLHVEGVASDAARLAEAIPDDAPPLLHLRGAVQRGNLVARLRARGLNAQDAVIYYQDAVPLSPQAVQALARPVLVPLYSPRTAQLFAAACPSDAWPNVRPAALSEAVAEVLPIPTKVAVRPDGEAMLSLISALLVGSAVEGRSGSL